MAHNLLNESRRWRKADRATQPLRHFPLSGGVSDGAWQTSARLCAFAPENQDVAVVRDKCSGKQRAQKRGSGEMEGRGESVRNETTNKSNVTFNNVTGDLSALARRAFVSTSSRLESYHRIQTNNKEQDIWSDGLCD